MADDDSLLDVFVNVKPRFDQDMDDITDAAIKKVKEKFLNANIPPIKIAAPVIGGGSGGSGKGAGSGLADEFEQAKRSAEDLRIRMRQIAETSREIGGGALSKEIHLASSELADIQLQLSRSKKDDDPLGLEDTVQRLDLIAARIDAIQTKTVQERTNRSVFDRLSVEDTNLRVSHNVESSLKQQAVQGLSADQRAVLLRGEADIKLQEAAVLAAKKAFDGSADSLHKYIAELVRLNGVTDVTTDAMQRLGVTLDDPTGDISNGGRGLRGAQIELQNLARVGGSSFNNLSNNAYQAGQAIEDFAVGFSLNGIAGGIRGAANNVAFILNDLSRTPQVQKAIGAEWAKQLPLIAGIGSALAIVVLPKLVEWLESLNDIEAGFRDITQELNDAFEARDFNIKFNTENESLRRSVEEAKSVQSILEKIRDLSLKGDEKRAELEGIFKGFDAKELGLDELTPIQNINTEFQKLSESIQKAGEKAVEFKKKQDFFTSPISPAPLLNSTFLENAGSVFGVESSDVAIGKLRAFKQEVAGLRLVIDDAIKKGQEGVATPETFIRAQRQIADFKKNVESNIGRLDLTDEDQKEAITALTGIADAVAKDFKRAEDILRETANITRESFAVAFDGVKEKVKELQNQLDLSRQVARGANIEFDVDLLGLDAQINEGRKLVEETIADLRQAAEESGIKIDEGGIKAIEEEFQLRSILSIEQLRKKNSEDLLALEEKRSKLAKFTAFEEYAKQLQLNALRLDDDEEKKRKNLQENALRLDKALGQVQAGEGFAEIASTPRGGFPSIQEQKDRDAANFKEAIRELLNPLGKIENSTKETVDAVKKIPGAVAR